MKFKSNYFRSMYSFGPTDYDLKFMHYYIDMKESDKDESRLIDEDLLNLKEYSGDKCFKLYFNDVELFNVFKGITNVFDRIKNNIYLRIRNNNEIMKCLVSDREVHKTTYKIAKKCDISYDWNNYKRLGG